MPKLALKINCRMLWKSNLEVRNKITEKCSLKSIVHIDFNIIKALTQCQNQPVFIWIKRLLAMVSIFG